MPPDQYEACLHQTPALHPQSGYSNWASWSETNTGNQPHYSPKMAHAMMGWKIDGKEWNGTWQAWEDGWKALVVCEHVCSPPYAPPSPPPPAPPPCDVLTLTFYNPCKCGWDGFNASMGGMLVGNASQGDGETTDGGGTSHSFETQADASAVYTTVEFCIWPGCHRFVLGPDAPGGLEWLLTERATEMPLLNGRGGYDQLYCHQTPYPPPSPPPPPPSPAPPGGSPAGDDDGC